MIDLHCHLIYETDDGAKKIENSINMLKEAYQAGFTKICCTPHYFEPHYTKTLEENQEKLEIIKEKLKDENIDIELFLGNEIYIDDKIDENIIKKNISKINNSEYILIELPIMFEQNNSEDIIYSLIRKGYNVILAHPERYVYVQKNIKYLDPFLEMGVYLQGNYESLIGKYGVEAKKTLKKLLKKKQISLMSTDNHRENSTYVKLEKILKVLKRYAKGEYFENITEINANKILSNKKI